MLRFYELYALERRRNVPKCTWHREIDERKKVNDYATPFLITLEDIKINLNKIHSTNRFETPLPNAHTHTLSFAQTNKRDFITKFYLM